MRVLLVASRHPWPPRRGDQVRVAGLASLLAGEHEVTLLVPEGPGPPPGEAAGCRVVTYRTGRAGALGGLLRALARGMPLQAGLFHRPHLGIRLRELAPQADLVILQLVRLAAYAGEAGTTPLMVDLVDSLSLNFSRRALFDRPWLGPWLRHEAGRLLRAERHLLGGARAGLLVSERDREWLAGRLPREVADRLFVVPLVVEAAAAPPPAGAGGSAAASLVLTGNLGYFVNADAVVWWLGQVWPAVRAVRPELTVTVAGARPSARVRRAAERPGVRLLASPPDLPAVLAAATVAVAPLRAGSGVPIKVLEAWAAGVPVIASPWAAAGAAATPGEDLLVAESPAEWRDAVVRLVADEPLRRRLAAAGLRRLAATSSGGVAGAALRRAVEAALRPAT